MTTSDATHLDSVGSSHEINVVYADFEDEAASARRGFVLYRILGNDLPPRHRSHQTVDNLRFILDNEPDLPDCEKRWVVNRIADPAMEKEVLDIIAGSGQGFIHIPFSLEEYTRQLLTSDGFPDGQRFHDPEFRASNAWTRARITEIYMRFRNRYAINNNGARNAALAEGRTRARWVLPWDGNLFVTRRAWDEVRTKVASASDDQRYLIVPMARLGDDWMHPDECDPSMATEEPQIAFRNDAAESFDKRLRYGWAPKAALLVRLGVDGRWNDWSEAIDAAAASGPSADAGRWVRGGWVVRLSSGNSAAERSDSQRQQNRREGVLSFLRGLHDQAISKALAGSPPVLFGSDAIVRLRGRPDLVERLELIAHTAVRSAHGEAMGIGGESEAGRDPGRTNVGRHAVVGLQRSFAQEIVASTLASALTGKAEYSEMAAQRVRALFLGAAAVTDPHHRLPDFAKVPSGRNDAIDMVAWRLLPFVLDAARLAQDQGTLDATDIDAMRTEATAMLNKLINSVAGEMALTSRNHVGTWYDFLMLGLASFVGDVTTIRDVVERAPMRIGQQFRRDGSQPEEDGGPQALHFAIFNMEAWTCMARAMPPFGFDPWAFAHRDGSSLARGMRLLSLVSKRRLGTAELRRRISAISLMSPWGPQLQEPGVELQTSVDSDTASGMPLLWWAAPASTSDAIEFFRKVRNRPPEQESSGPLL